MTLESYVSTQSGMSLAEYKKQIKQQLIAQNYIVTQKRNELQALSQVSHDEITRFYNNNQTKFVQPEIATLFMVLVPKGSDEAAAKKSADDLLASVKSGKLKKEAMIENTKKGETKYQAGYVYAARGDGIAQQLNMTQKEFDDLFNSKIDTFSAVQEQNDHFRFYAVTKKDATRIIDVVFKSAAEGLANGETVKVCGFGTFVIKTKVARKGVNPKTKEEIIVPETKVVGFKPAEALKAKVKK